MPIIGGTHAVFISSKEEKNQRWPRKQVKIMETSDREVMPIYNLD